MVEGDIYVHYISIVGRYIKMEIYKYINVRIPGGANGVGWIHGSLTENTNAKNQLNTILRKQS